MEQLIRKSFTTQVILAEIENDLRIKKISELERFPFGFYQCILLQ